MSQVPYSRVESLYRRLFSAEKSGDVELQTLIKRELDRIISGEDSGQDIPLGFTSHLKDKAKKTYLDLIALLEGGLNELDLAIEVSSLITQTILISKRQFLDAAEVLDLNGQVNLLSDVIRGEAGLDEARAFYKMVLQDAIPKSSEGEEIET